MLRTLSSMAVGDSEEGVAAAWPYGDAALRRCGMQGTSYLGDVEAAVPTCSCVHGGRWPDDKLEVEVLIQRERGHASPYLGVGISHKRHAVLRPPGTQSRVGPHDRHVRVILEVIGHELKSAHPYAWAVSFKNLRML